MTQEKDLTKEQNKELQKIIAEILADAIQMRIDYEEHPSNLDSGSVIEIHQDSPLLEDENKKLGDVILTIKKKSKKKGDK
jgi:hypothetical protein